MDAKLVVLLCLVAVAVNVYAAPSPGGMMKKLEAEDSVCGLVGRSGKIVCHKVLKGKCDGEDDDMTTGAPEDDKKNSTEKGDKSGEKDDKDKCYKTHAVEMYLDKITELNSDNETVDSKHAYNSFASQDFTLSDPVDDVSIPNAGDLKGKKVSMTITLTNKATITIDVYLIKGEGTVEMDGEEIEVKKGMMKFSVSMTNWTWCGEKQGVTDINEPCSAKTGTQLEVHFAVKSRGKPKPKDREGKRGKRFELGGDAVMELSEKKDGAWTNMVDGFPMIKETGNKNFIILRFDRFTDTVYYDPETDFGTWPEGADGPISGAVTSHITSALACVFTIFAAMFVF